MFANQVIIFYLRKKLEKRCRNVWLVYANSIPLHPLSKRKAFKE